MVSRGIVHQFAPRRRRTKQKHKQQHKAFINLVKGTDRPGFELLAVGSSSRKDPLQKRASILLYHRDVAN